MRYLIVLLLVGCATDERQFNAQADAAFDRCVSMGHAAGSEGHYLCVRREMGMDRARPERTTCRRDSFGQMQCATR